MPLISGTARFCKKNAVARGVRALFSTCLLYGACNLPLIETGADLAAPAGQKAAPAAGLGVRRIDLFREFVADGLVVDPGIVGLPDNGNHGPNAGWGGPGVILGNVLPLPEQWRRRYACGFALRRGGGRGPPHPLR